MTDVNPTSKPTKSAPYHHGDLRNALTQSAIEVLERDGVEKLSLRGVARNAGVSAAAPYHHFKDKTALLVEVALKGFELFIKTLQDSADGQPTPAARRAAFGAGYVKFAVENPAMFQLMFTENHALVFVDDRVRAFSDQSYALLETATREMLTRDGIAPSRSRSSRLTALAWATAHGLAMLMTTNTMRWREFGLGDAYDTAFALLQVNDAHPGEDA